MRLERLYQARRQDGNAIGSIRDTKDERMTLDEHTRKME